MVLSVAVDDVLGYASYLELGCRVGRIRRKQLQHVDNAADGPRTHAIVLVLQETLVGQRLCDGHERVPVRLFLINCPQFIVQRLESRQEVAHANLLAGPANKRLLELELRQPILHCFLLFQLLLFFFDHLGRRGRAPPTARCHVAWLRVGRDVWRWCGGYVLPLRLRAWESDRRRTRLSSRLATR